MMRTFLLLVLSVACNSGTSESSVVPQASKTPQSKKDDASQIQQQAATLEPSKPPAPTPPPTPLPPLVEVSGAPRFLGDSAIYQHASPDLPSLSELDPAYFYFKPILGAEVTIVPRCERESFTAQITSISPQHIDETKQWEVQFAPIAKTIVPRDCDLFVVYPKQASIKELALTTLKKKWLPRKVTLAHVKTALDSNADGKPDLLLTTYCTDEPKKAECYEATATVLYSRKGNRWRKVHTWHPIS